MSLFGGTTEDKPAVLSAASSRISSLPSSGHLHVDKHRRKGLFYFILLLPGWLLL